MSKVAAKEAITNTLLSRMCYIVPIFYVNFFWGLGLKKMNLFPRHGTLPWLLVEVSGVALGLYIAMPLNCALYP